MGVRAYGRGGGRWLQVRYLAGTPACACFASWVVGSGTRGGVGVGITLLLLLGKWIV